jgi:hypothetical protein
MKFRAYAYTIVGLMILLVVLLSVSSQQSLTYRSKAQVQTEQAMTSTSQSISRLSQTEKGLCVKDLTYLPVQSDMNQSCFVQFTCIDDVQGKALPQTCSLDNKRITCDSLTACQSVSAWAQQARTYCGCD